MKIFREAKESERMELFEQGYLEWSKKRTFEKYCEDNAKEDSFGTRYVVVENNAIVSSMILLKLPGSKGREIYGIGSVVTPKEHMHKGYASFLLSECLEQNIKKEDVVFLYSDVAASFYERFGFQVLPQNLQREKDSICMVLCDEVYWGFLMESTLEIIPEHF